MKRLYHDPLLHAQHIAFLRARAQARYRKEPWELSLDHYFALWQGCWEQRGRSRNSLVLARIDLEGGWTIDNVEITTRYEQLLKKFVVNNWLTSSPDYQKRTYKPRKIQ
jgi:hypothetical protein